MKLRSMLKSLLGLCVVAGLAGVGYHTRDRWMPKQEEHSETTSAPTAVSEQVLLSEQAQKNLNLTSAALTPTQYWKKITVPGVIIDRPGYTDRGIVTPATGIVASIHHFPGDTIKPGDLLFTIRLLSETLHLTQTELFKATQDVKLTTEQKRRLTESGGAVPEARIIEVENQITRLQIAMKAYRLELQNRGLIPEQIDGVMEGKFVTELTIRAPQRPIEGKPLVMLVSMPKEESPAFEVQELKVELGQQVQVGQTLCTLANHQMLAIEGYAFRDETSLVERAVRNNWNIEVDFQEDPSAKWDKFEQPLLIRYLSNTIDPMTRTFTFLIPFENDSRLIHQNERTLILWRFRPGHQVRLEIQVEELKNVFVLPTDAVVREGGDAFVFRRNGDVYDRKPVHVVYQDRKNVIVANDGSVPAGIHVAQAGATQLNRMIKSQSSSLPKGFHMHADGSVHQGSH